jgi:hypothetical protein
MGVGQAGPVPSLLDRAPLTPAFRQDRSSLDEEPSALHQALIAVYPFLVALRQNDAADGNASGNIKRSRWRDEEGVSA